MKQNYFDKIILGTAHFDRDYGLIKRFQLSEYYKILDKLKKKKVKIIFDTSFDTTDHLKF